MSLVEQGLRLVARDIYSIENCAARFPHKVLYVADRDPLKRILLFCQLYQRAVREWLVNAMPYRHGCESAYTLSLLLLIRDYQIRNVLENLEDLLDEWKRIDEADAEDEAAVVWEDIQTDPACDFLFGH